jgi:N-acetyl-beta-hexosaminidase
VDANRVALQQFVDQGVNLRETQLKKALDDLEKFEDALIGSVRKTAEAAGAQLAGPWQQVLEKMQVQGTASGAEATNAAEQLGQQMQEAMRSSRAAGLKAVQALAESYSALVSGVLIGMSDALRQRREESGSAGRGV